MDFKYDLSISLLEEDAQLGWDIVNKLGNPDKVFFYKKDVDTLTFRNGANVFGNVFSHQSRFNLVLHREKYGTTDWTALEYSIIQDRFKKTIKTGDCPLLFCKLDESPKPSWLPETYIYSTIDDIESLVRLIRKRITDKGGLSFPQNSDQRLRINIAQKKYEESFLWRSQHEPALANEARTEAGVLRNKLFERLSKSAKDNQIQFNETTRPVGSNIPIARLDLEIGNVLLYLKDEQPAINSIDEACLVVKIYSRPATTYDRSHKNHKPILCKNYEKHFYITSDNISGWRNSDKKDFLTSDGFVELIFNDIVEILTK